MRVVVSAVARYLAAEPLGPGILLVDSRKLDLGQCQSLVVAVELVDLEGVAADRHQIAVFVDKRADGKIEQLARIAARNLRLPLETLQPAVVGCPLDSQVGALVA